MIARPLSLALLLATALPWATGWTLLGFWLLASGSAPQMLLGVPIDAPAPIRVAGGVTALAAGQLIFLCFVADRVYPWANRRMVAVVELALCAAMFLGLAVSGLGLLGAFA